MYYNKDTGQLEGKVEIPNLRVMHIQNQAIARSNKPLNKYNEALHQDTEALTGEPGDRNASDTGMEPEMSTQAEVDAGTSCDIKIEPYK